MDDFDSPLFYATLLVIYITGVIASAGGIGGGGLIVPILLVLGNLSYYQATVCSSCALLGNYLAQFLINYHKAHPRVLQRPLIYWHAVLALIPAQLGGSNIGVLLINILPQSPLLFLAMFVLLAVIIKTTIKLQHLLHDEGHRGKDDIFHTRQTIREGGTSDVVLSVLHKDSGASSTNNEDFLEMRPSADIIADSYLHSMKSRHSTHSAPTSATIEAPIVKIPYFILSLVALAWFTYVILFLITQYAVPKCSPYYYLMLFIVYPFLIMFTYFTMRYLKKKQTPNYASGDSQDLDASVIDSENIWKLVDGDLDFSKLSYSIPVMAFVVGMLCSLLGIGGGELMGPLLLSLHLLPQVTTATISSMSVLTTANNAVHYLVLGDVPYVLAGCLFVIGAAAGSTGRQLALYYSKKYNRNSIFVMMLLVILVCSVFLLIYDIVVNEQDYDLHSLC